MGLGYAMDNLIGGHLIAFAGVFGVYSGYRPAVNFENVD